VLNIHKGFSFEFHTAKVNDEAWLPVTIDGQGSARFLLVDGIHGRMHLVASNYRKFHATSTISAIGAEVTPDGQPVTPLPDAPKP
jgi:hypothetical protein